MDTVLQDKLKKLRAYYFDDDTSLRWVQGVEDRIKALIIKDELTKHQSVVAIIEDAHDRIRAIDLLLANDESLDTDARNKLFKEKAVHQFYLSRLEVRDFDKANESIINMLDEELDRIKQ